MKKLTCSNIGFKLLVTIKATRPVFLEVIGYDKKIKRCVYFQRFKSNQPDGTFYGTETIEFFMPIVPKHLQVEAFNEANGSDAGITITNVQEVPLGAKFDIKRPDILDFKVFSDWLAQYGGALPTDTYTSPGGFWKVHLVDTILDADNNFKPIDTAASVMHDTGEIFVKAKEFRGITVPNRKVVLWHELNHYVNKSYNESECDHFAMVICTAEGYGRYDITDTGARLFGFCDPTKRDCTEQEQRVVNMYNWFYN